MKTLSNVKFFYLVFFICLTLQHINAQDYTAKRAAIAPEIDGNGNDICWTTVDWAPINYSWDGLANLDSTDYYGQYKAVWTPEKVYFLVEITDDELRYDAGIDNGNYYDNDCLELFIDEDHVSEGHECGQDAFNAFAYHIMATPVDKNTGNVTSFGDPNEIFNAMDLGTDCNTVNKILLNNNIDVKISKNGNKYTWEIGLYIFDNTYQENGNNIPVALSANKIMGFAFAYCDNDDGHRDNMKGSLDNHNDWSGPYPCYRFTHDFASLTLEDATAGILSVKDNSKLINSGDTLIFNSTTSSRTVNLYNIGTKPLNINDISVTGSAFSVGTTQKSVLSPGDSTNLVINFSGNNTNGEGSISIISDGENSPFIINLMETELTGILDNINYKKLQVYPNPFNDKLNICYAGNNPVTVYIYNILGKKLLRREVYSGELINVALLPHGTYILRIGESEPVFQKLIVKQAQ